MVALIERHTQKIQLQEIVRQEVGLYAGNTHEAKLYPVFDEVHRLYMVVIVPEKDAERPAWVLVMAQVIEDYVVILEESAIDKPLVEALMKNGGIPREKIILAYAGEKLPE